MDPSNNEFRTSTDDPHVSDAGKVTDFDPATKRKVLRTSQRAGLIGQRFAEKKAAAHDARAAQARPTTRKHDDFNYGKLRREMFWGRGIYNYDDPPEHRTKVEREILRDPKKFHDTLAAYYASRRNAPHVALGAGGAGAGWLLTLSHLVKNTADNLRKEDPEFYTGDVYEGIKTESHADAKKLRIASAVPAALGLYGAYRSHKYNKALTRSMSDPERREALRAEMERRYEKEKTATLLPQKVAATADAERLARAAAARQHLNSDKSDDYDYEKLRGGVRGAAGRYDPSHELEREILRDPEKFHDALAVYRISRKDMPKIPLGLGALGALSLWSKAKDVERAVGRLRVLYPNLYDTEESLSGARTRARAFAKKLRIAAAVPAVLGLYGAHRSHKYNKALTRDMNDPARREALRGEMERRYGKEKTAMAPLLAAALPAVAGKLAPSVLSGLAHIAKPGLLPLIGAGAGALYGGYRNGWQGALNGFMTGGMVGKGLESRVFAGGAPPAQGQAQSQAQSQAQGQAQGQAPQQSAP